MTLRPPTHRTSPTPPALTTQAEYDYRVLQPTEVTDPNGNRTTVAYTPLGLPAAHGRSGQDRRAGGDTPAQPGTRWTYDFQAYDAPAAAPSRSRSAPSAGCITTASRRRRDRARRDHQHRGVLRRVRPAAPDPQQAEDVAFGDPSFGGDAGLPADQTRRRRRHRSGNRHAPATRRVVVSGWQTYDNKGRVVEKYEPFFSLDGTYRSPDEEAATGQRPSGRSKPSSTTRSAGRSAPSIPTAPNKRVIHGVPGSIAAPDAATPDVYQPTAWETYTYDANDNAGRTHPDHLTSYQTHWNTPTSALIDARAAPCRSTRNGPDPATDWYSTRSGYDIRGNLLTLTDPLGRVAFRHTYNLAPKRTCCGWRASTLGYAAACWTPPGTSSSNGTARALCCCTPTTSRIARPAVGPRQPGKPTDAAGTPRLRRRR